MNKNNQRKQIIIEQIKKNIIVIITVISLFIILTANKTTEIKTTKNNNIKALDQEGNTYRLVTSADNVQVPVPKGYVASQVTGENYVTPQYQHTTISHKGNYTELTWSSPEGEQYPWTQDENGIWISGNQGIPSSTSTLESEEFDYIKGTTLTINYTYSCQSYSDYLNIDLINITNDVTTRIIDRKSGNTSTSFDYITSNNTYTIYDWATGRYKIKATYNKNSSTNEGQDSAYIKLSRYYKEDENGTEIVEDDIKTKIHDGGFVIYQLTDSELETDPKGTNVIINDTNKDISQATRNQYVWVPVENIEDIVRTKTANNGIMQFGQVYIFNNTSITKETNTGTDNYTEPRLVEQYDKTKYYLQKNSNENKREDYLKKMQEEYGRMIKSINKYKGFYIGRYETGDEISHSSSIACFKNQKVVRYNSNINYVTWYDSYKALERLSGKTGEYVETGMLYDSLWDYTLKWLQETNTRTYKDIKSDSGTWGNYKNNSFKYKESSNGEEKINNENSNIMTPTGSITEITYKGEKNRENPTASNNVFDIAGNTFEWTRATCNYIFNRKNRGGGYYHMSSSFQASYFGNGNPYQSTFYYGSRTLLLIM